MMHKCHNAVYLRVTEIRLNLIELLCLRIKREHLQELRPNRVCEFN